MLKEAIQLVMDTAKAANAVQSIPVKDPRNARFMYRDEVFTVPIPPPPRAHVLESLEDLCRLAYVHAGTDVEIWHSNNKVVVVFDGNDRRDTAGLDLLVSDQFRFATELSESSAMNQRSLIRCLRMKLGFANTTVLNALRKLEWTGSSASRSEVQRTKESLGKEVMAAVNATEDIPEVLTIDIPVYELPEASAPVAMRFDLDVDVTNQQFTLCPQPGETARAMNLAQAMLRDAIEGYLSKHGADGVEVYRGAP